MWERIQPWKGWRLGRAYYAPTGPSPFQRQAGAARASVLGGAGAHRMGTVATDEATVLIGDHGLEVGSCHAIQAANNENGVG